MITVKQVLENYDILTEKADNDSKNLVALVHAGLLDESQLPILRRAMSKPAINMTEAEKKALHSLVESVSSCIISEKQDYLSKLDTSRSMGYPPEKDIPAVIILKRKAIRVYPDNQKVALYYSQALDRYISIPYGKNSKALDMTLNEERLDEISQEDWAGPIAVKRAKFTSASPDEQKKMAMGLSAKERANIPGATTKAVMGALQHGGAEGIGAAAGALIGTGTRKLAGLVMKKIRGDVPDPEAKTIKPGKVKAELQKPPEVKPTEPSKAMPLSTPNTPVSQRLGAVQARTNRNRPRPMRESFRKKLEEKRQEKLDEATIALPAITSGVLTAGRVVKNIFSKKSPSKAQDRMRTREQRRLEREKARKRRTGEDRDRLRYRDTYINIGGGGSGGGSDEPLLKLTQPDRPDFGEITQGSTARVSQSTSETPSAGQLTGIQRQARAWNVPQPPALRESNNLNILKQMVEHNISSHVIHINETPITINNRVAKKVVNVYESLNRQNKRKVEKMLNEDATSFKKIINFAVRQ